MFQPQFPYKGNQIILSSDRVVIHAKNDAIFLFGKQAVGLSSTKTINLDANERILLSCAKIELGQKAESLGEPVILGRSFTRELKRVMDQLQIAATFLAQVSESDLATSMFFIQSAGAALADQVETFNNVLSRQETLSKNTFTR